MQAALGSPRQSNHLLDLAAVWLGVLVAEGLVYAIVERAGCEGSLVELGTAVVVFSSPFLLAAFTLISLWGVVRGSPRALAAVWGVGAAVVGVAWLIDQSAGVAPITIVVFMARSVLLLGPHFLGVFTLVWLFDRWRRAP